MRFFIESEVYAKEDTRTVFVDIVVSTPKNLLIIIYVV